MAAKLLATTPSRALLRLRPGSDTFWRFGTGTRVLQWIVCRRWRQAAEQASEQAAQNDRIARADWCHVAWCAWAGGQVLLCGCGAISRAHVGQAGAVVAAGPYIVPPHDVDGHANGNRRCGKKVIVVIKMISRVARRPTNAASGGINLPDCVLPQEICHTPHNHAV
jgi:hypothetical protein